MSIIDRFITLTNDPLQRERMIHDDNERAFFLAAANGHLHIVNRLVELTPLQQNLERMIHANYDYAFCFAAAHGHISIVNRLITLTNDPLQREQMIHARNDTAFISAAATGHLSIINKLIELTSDFTRRKRAIHSRKDKNKPFYHATANGHLSRVNKLIALTPDKETLYKMIFNLNYHSFRCAVTYGHINIVNRLIYLTPDLETFNQMLHSVNDSAFYHTAKKGHLDMSQYLLSFAPELKFKMLEHGKDEKFKQKIRDSTKFIQKLIQTRERGDNYSVAKTFDYLNFGKVVINLVVVSKYFTDFLQGLGGVDVILDCLENKNSDLTRSEKMNILSILRVNHSAKDDIRAPDQKDNILLNQPKNTQDQKVSFVERVHAKEVVNYKGRVLNIG